MRPPPLRIITRPTAWLTKNFPFRFTASVASKSASVTASAALGGPIPALLIRMSMRPNARSVSGDRRRDLGAARDVHLQRQRAAPQRADRLRRTAVGARVAVAERDVGPRLRQRERARAPQALAPRRSPGRSCRERRSGARRVAA